MVALSAHMLHNPALIYSRQGPFEELELHEFGAGTHVGNLRDNNEDSYACDPEKELWIVADGMGGLGFGEVASAISTYTVATHVKEGHGINQAIEIAHKRIKEYADTEGKGTNMGTTMVLLLSQGSLYNVFWVGDSRAYSFLNNKVTQLTTDHSLVQSLIEQGEITAEEAESDPRKNAVTRALGVQELETVRADSISEKWQPGQKILLCSDGLTDCVSTDEIAAILAEEGSEQDHVDRLIEAALAGGGKDNITIILVAASASVSRNESDTHVPGDATDSTHVPRDDNQTERNQRNPPAQSSQGPDQVSGQQFTRTTAQLSSEPAEREAPKSAWWDVRSWFGAFAMVVAVTVFAGLTNSGETSPESFSSAELIQLGAEESVPMARQGMPDIELPEPGTVLQLGLFSKLDGAEIQQQATSRKGFVPFIEKKVDGENIQFAVLLGPFYDEQQIRATSDALEQEGIRHFKRPES